jgi:hypothetical protein
MGVLKLRLVRLNPLSKYEQTVNKLRTKNEQKKIKKIFLKPLTNEKRYAIIYSQRLREQPELMKRKVKKMRHRTYYGEILKGEVVDFKHPTKPFYIKGRSRSEVIDKAKEKCNGRPLCVHWVWSLTDENYDKYAFAEGEVDPKEK